MSRKSRNKPLSKVITIYCEGESEVAYFKMLGRKYRKLKTIHTDKVKVKSLDANGISILEEAYRQESNKGKRVKRFTWHLIVMTCVMMRLPVV